MSALVTSAIIGGAALLGSAGASAISAGKMNRRAVKYATAENQRQRAFQKEYSEYLSELEARQNREYWNKYNSPSAQRIARMQAGMSPFADASGVQAMGVDPGSYSGSSPSSQSFTQPGGNVMSPLAPAFASGVQQFLSARQAEENIQLTAANTAKTQAETIKTQQENSLFAFTKAAAESDALSKRFKANIAEVEARFAEVQSLTDLDERNARIESIWAQAKNSLASAAKSDADRLYLDFMKDANRANVQSQTALNQAQTGAATSSAALMDAQRETEEALRSGRISLTEEQARAALASAGLSEARAGREYNELIEALTNTRSTNSLWGIVDRYIRKTEAILPGGPQGKADELRFALIKAISDYSK